MLFLFSCILLILLIFVFYEKNILIKIAILNIFTTISMLFILYYSSILGYNDALSFIDIVFIYFLISFIMNLSLVKFYKKINSNEFKN